MKYNNNDNSNSISISTSNDNNMNINDHNSLYNNELKNIFSNYEYYHSVYKDDNDKNNKSENEHFSISVPSTVINIEEYGVFSIPETPDKKLNDTINSNEIDNININDDNNNISNNNNNNNNSNGNNDNDDDINNNNNVINNNSNNKDNCINDEKKNEKINLNKNYTIQNNEKNTEKNEIDNKNTLVKSIVNINGNVIERKNLRKTKIEEDNNLRNEINSDINKIMEKSTLKKRKNTSGSLKSLKKNSKRNVTASTKNIYFDGEKDNNSNSDLNKTNNDIYEKIYKKIENQNENLIIINSLDKLTDKLKNKDSNRNTAIINLNENNYIDYINNMNESFGSLDNHKQPLSKRSIPTSQSLENINKIYEKFNEYNKKINNSSKIIPYNVVNMSGATASFPQENSFISHHSYKTLKMHTGMRKRLEIKNSSDELNNSKTENKKDPHSLSVDNITKHEVNEDFYKTYKSAKKDAMDDKIRSNRSFLNRNHSSNDYRKKLFYGSGSGGINKPLINDDTKISKPLMTRSLSLTHSPQSFSYEKAIDSILGNSGSLENSESMNNAIDTAVQHGYNGNYNENGKSHNANSRKDSISNSKSSINNTNKNKNKNYSNKNNGNKNDHNINNDNNNTRSSNNSRDGSNKKLTLTPKSSKDDYYYNYKQDNQYHYLNGTSTSKDDINGLGHSEIQIINYKHDINENNMPLVAFGKGGKISSDIHLPPIKGLVSQQGRMKRFHSNISDVKFVPINHKNIKAKVDDRNSLGIFFLYLTKLL